MALQLKLFGEFEILGPEQSSIVLPTRRTSELLARLSLADSRSLEKGVLAGEIWPHVPPDSAKQSLRKSLSFIRSSLGEAVLATGSGLRLAPGIETDLARIKSSLYRAKLASDGESAALELTVIDKLTAKPLLAGWESEWIEPFRQEWNEVRFTALLKLSDHHKQFRQKEASLNFALAASSLNPFSEAAAARVLSAYDDLGHFAEAESHYRVFAGRLENELDLSPSRDLVEIIRQIRAQKTGIQKPSTPKHQGILSLLIDQVYQENPGQLVELLASEGLSWLIYTKAHEVLPVFIRAAESVDSWNEPHRRVVKDLLALASFVYDIDLLKTWSHRLAQASQRGTYDDIVASCMKARWMTAEGDLSGAIEVLNTASLDAASLKNSYLESVVLANKAGCHFQKAEYQIGIQLMESQLESLLASSTRRGRLALAEAYGALAQYRLITGKLSQSKTAIDECWKIASVADIGGMETGTTSLKGLIDLLTGEDISCRNLVEGLTASVQHRNTNAILSSMTHAAAGMHHRGQSHEAGQLAETVLCLSRRLGLCIYPSQRDFMTKYAGVTEFKTDSHPLFDGSLPKIAAWVHEQLQP